MFKNKILTFGLQRYEDFSNLANFLRYFLV